MTIFRTVLMVVIGIVTIVLPSCGTNDRGANGTSVAAVTNMLFGDWEGLRKIEGIDYKFRLKIEKDKIHEKTQCTFSDGTVLSTEFVSSAAKFDLENINVLETQSAETKSGTKSCGVALSPRHIRYQLNSNKLFVTNLNQGFTDVLTKTLQ